MCVSVCVFVRNAMFADGLLGMHVCECASMDRTICKCAKVGQCFYVSLYKLYACIYICMFI